MSLLFLLMLLVLGGVIAYFADRLGRTLGKKRLSLFGLRPRHTAELLTVSAGAIIPLVTFAIVMAASADVREWILHSPEYKRDRDKAIKDLTSARLSLKTIQDDLKLEQDRLTQSKKELDRASLAVQQMQRTQARLMGDVKTQTALAHRAQGQYSVALAQYHKVNGQYVLVRGNYERVHAQYAETNRKYSQVNASYKTLSGTYKSLQDSYNNLLTQEKEANAEVQRDKVQLDKVSKQLQTEQGQLDQTRKDYQTAKQDLQSAQDQLETTRLQLDQLKALANQLYTTANTAMGVARINSIMFERGDEIARLEVPAGLTEQQAKAALQNVLERASATAAQKGAKPNSSGFAAGIVSVTEDLTAEKQIDAVAKALTGTREPSALVASSLYNTFEGEFTPVLMNVYNNPMVYKRNQAIAETLVQGAFSDEQIFKQISDFLKTKVKDQAKRAKMIPVAGKEDSFGEVGSGEILTLVKQIRNVGRPVRLIAYVAQDTRAADPLDLKFQLRL